MHPKKSLGQNFLNDRKILQDIVDYGEISNDDVVLEIGPGTGNLTKKLLEKKPKKLIVVEKDNIDIRDTTAFVKKTMGYNPRRITKIEIDITFPKDYDSRTKTMLERAAFNCPVHHTLSELSLIHISEPTRPY